MGMGIISGGYSLTSDDSTAVAYNAGKVYSYSGDVPIGKWIIYYSRSFSTQYYYAPSTSGTYLYLASYEVNEDDDFSISHCGICAAGTKFDTHDRYASVEAFVAWLRVA